MRAFVHNRSCIKSAHTHTHTPQQLFSQTEANSSIKLSALICDDKLRKALPQKPGNLVHRIVHIGQRAPLMCTGQIAQHVLLMCECCMVVVMFLAWASQESLPAAAATFVSHGHAIWSSTRVCDQRPWETARDALSDPSLMQQQAGAWGLVQREEPLGTIVEEYTEGDGPLRLQADAQTHLHLLQQKG